MRGFAYALAILLGFSTYSFGGSSPKGEYLQKGYYIVVAAYRIGQEKHMETYVDKLNKSGLHTKYGYDLGRKFYYIYLDYYTDFDESIHEMLRTRKEGGFTDAWVRIMPDLSPEKNVSTPDPEVEKIVVQNAASPNQVDNPNHAADNKPEPVVTIVADQPVLTETVISNEVAGPIENPKNESKDIPKTLMNTPVFLSLFHSRNGKMVEGEVEVIDTERSRLITKVKGNTFFSLPDPKSKSGELTLVGNTFGYRKLQHQLNFRSGEDTLPPYLTLVDSFYNVRFDLVRYHRGDISTLYNVYFYNDAAIMLPESTFELNRLLQMLQENPDYKIMLHGHTNGNSRGKIIKMGPSKNFFALTDDVKNEIGSAKDLSRERAQVIKDWLVSQGVDAVRIEITAWGGGRMIHEKESANAKKNVRVEVEILAE
jgi:outer membrane protein OmpA-like peptidoglycan-associated protein